MRLEALAFEHRKALRLVTLNMGTRPFKWAGFETMVFYQYGYGVLYRKVL